MRRWSLGLGALGASLVVGCGGAEGAGASLDAGGDASVGARAQAAPLVESRGAIARAEVLRARFVHAIVPEHVERDLAAPRRRSGAEPTEASKPRPVIGDGVVDRFEVRDDGLVRPIVAERAKRGLRRLASVTLPTDARAPVTVEDEGSRLAVRFSLLDASPSRLEVGDGLGLYRGALRGADVVHRPHAEGVEDFVAFETKPAKEELAYRVDVSQVAGLRLTADVLELLDEAGDPRLRVAHPYVVDAKGARHDAALAVEGCAYDTSPLAPWGRGVTTPGADECTVRVTWRAVEYPAIVDPNWVATGSMTRTRRDHTASLLADGRVLIAGGANAESTAELYDETTGTFASAGAMKARHQYATATVLPSGKVLIAGSSITASMSAAELYDPATGFTLTGAMKAGRAEHGAALLPGGKVLLVGGFTSGIGRISTAEIFDGTSTFALTGSLPSARGGFITVALPASGKALIAGGHLTASGTYTSQAFLFDGAAFVATGSMAQARSYHSAALLANGKVLISGGDDGGGPLATAELFDGTGSFASTGSMPGGREAQLSALLKSGKVVVAGGNDGSVEIFNGTSTFTGADPLPDGYWSGALTALNSGRALWTGGGAETTSFASAYVFQLLPGDACAAAADCGTGLCDGGFCCKTYCGTCQACAAGTGSCVAVASADDADTCTGTKTCSASGSCRLKNGQPPATSGYPTGAASCASGIVADGVCCDAACTGACDYCNKAGTLGACTVVAGDPGVPSCAPYLCQSSASCTSSCSSDANCASGNFCSGGSCVAKRTQGSTCPTGNHECASGFCADGFCCNDACTANCKACSAAKSGVAGGDGTCNFVVNGGTGRGECGAPSCTGSSLSTPSCNGSGSCTTATSNCTPSSCNAAGNACQTSCTSDAQCSAGNWCDAPSCVAKRSNGGACTGSNQCVSGACVDGVCCSSACTGPCEACNEAGHVGSCTAVTGNPRAGHGACNGGGTTCGGTCDGANTAFCSYPNVGKVCNGGCSGSSLSVCSASGSCLSPVACAGNYACASAAACRTSCAGDSDCAAGNFCAGSACVPKAANGGVCSTDGQCSSAHCVSGVCCASACAGGYTCQAGGGSCKATCGGDADCTNGYYCNGSACAAKKANGLACTATNQCSSGFCVDGVCCGAACTGSCQACTAAKSGVAGGDGTCNFVIDGQDPDGNCGAPTCTGGNLNSNVCNGTGSCKAAVTSCGGFGCNAAGNACQKTCTLDGDCSGSGFYCASGTCAAKKTTGTTCAAARECASGNCVDSMCCSSACTGPCEACNEAGKAGSCSPVTGSPRTGHAACNGGGTACVGTCDGVNTAVCSYPNVGKVCGGGCAGSSLEVCSATGSCLAPSACPGNLTCATASACRSTCGGDAECVSGYFCSSGGCVAKLTDGGACTTDAQCGNGHCVSGTCCASACGGGYTCKADGSSCKTTCGSDVDCTSGSYCAGGACTAKKAGGTTCGGGTECTSGFCVDGVCCDKQCAGNCQACTAAKTGVAGGDGTCSFVKDATDPDGDCGKPSCSGGSVTSNVCNGTGACRAITTSCGGFGCNATNDACKKDCAADGDCPGGYCNLTTKQCAAKKARAEACGGNVECASGTCADGVCCDGACDGQCEACAEPGSIGTCSPVKNKPRGARPSCVGYGTECGGVCDGKITAQCTFPNLETSCGAGCKDGAIAQCDGAGACRDAKACPGGFACDGTTACKSKCTASVDCGAGFACDVASGKCVSVAVSSTCSADLSQSIPAGDAGAPEECAPFKCGSDGKCKTTCATTNDCASSATCDTSRATPLCVPTAPDAPKDGGCGCDVPGKGREGWAASLAIAAALAAIARRRRRAA